MREYAKIHQYDKLLTFPVSDRLLATLRQSENRKNSREAKLEFDPKFDSTQQSAKMNKMDEFNRATMAAGNGASAPPMPPPAYNNQAMYPSPPRMEQQGGNSMETIFA